MEEFVNNNQEVFEMLGGAMKFDAFDAAGQMSWPRDSPIISSPNAESSPRFDFVTKLAYFPEKVASVLARDPADALSVVYLDLNTDICNHRCHFCDGFYRSLESGSIPTERVLRLVSEMEDVGVSAVVIAGDRGEPLLHPGAEDILLRLADSPIEVGLYTNGTILPHRLHAPLSRVAWVRVSADAGTSTTHHLMHNYPPGRQDFEHLLKNLAVLVKLVGDVGASFILDETNAHEIEVAANTLLPIGLKFLEFKPKYLPDYSVDSDWLRCMGPVLSVAIERARARWGKRIVLNNQVEALIKGDVPPRLTTVPRTCRTSLLRMVISSHGCYSCTPFRGEPARRFGDIQSQSLVEVLSSPERRALVEQKCERLCAYDAQNEFLLGLEEGRVALPRLGRGQHPQDAFI
jgi:organic radical activating enzyme